MPSTNSCYSIYTTRVGMGSGLPKLMRQWPWGELWWHANAKELHTIKSLPFLIAETHKGLIFLIAENHKGLILYYSHRNNNNNWIMRQYHQKLCSRRIRESISPCGESRLCLSQMMHTGSCVLQKLARAWLAIFALKWIRYFPPVGA